MHSWAFEAWRESIILDEGSIKTKAFQGRDLGLAVVSLGSRGDVIDDIVAAAIRNALFCDKKLHRSRNEFDTILAGAGENLADNARKLEQILTDLLHQVVAIRKNVKSSKNPSGMAMAAGDINQRLSQLFYPGFLRQTPLEHIEDYSRYLKAIEIRLEKAAQQAVRDRRWSEVLAAFWERHQDRLQKEGE